MFRKFFNPSEESLVGNDSFLFPSFLSLSILLFYVITHLLVMIGFVVGFTKFWLVIPLAFVLGIAISDLFAKATGATTRNRLYLIVAQFTTLIVTIALAGALYDMSWDGLWYHQTAIYQMAKVWNPVYDPLKNFEWHLQDWVRHYAKGPWYFALGLHSLSGNIEFAKAAPWMMLIASFLAVYSVGLQYGLTKINSSLIAFFVAFNPVVVFELASFLVDGLLVSFLAIFVASVLSYLKKPSVLNILLIVLSIIALINAKLTGLVYLGFAASGFGLYYLLFNRSGVIGYVKVVSISIFLGIALFGYNPYITNYLHRGNPFYPILGSAEFPSHADQGEDAIEKWETPGNMVGQSRFVRLGYAIFGRPGAQPFHPGKDAVLMLPFTVGIDDFAMYYFHDVRISGFGPLFSGILLLSLILLVLLYKKPNIPWKLILFFWAFIVVSLLISTHTWWARYGPQMWWLPLVVLVASFYVTNSKAVVWLRNMIVVLLFINTLPIALVHFNWETQATHKTNEQLEMLKTKKNVTVDFQFFAEPFGERMKKFGINYRKVKLFEEPLPCKEPLEIISVSPGYPMAVKVCYEK